MDIKTLSTIIGHVSSSTTLNVYAHSEEDCEKLLTEMVTEMKAEIADERLTIRCQPQNEGWWEKVRRFKNGTAKQRPRRATDSD